MNSRARWPIGRRMYLVTLSSPLIVGYPEGMFATQTLATERDIVAALKGMHEVDGVHACEFILTYDDKFDECVANVALILDEAEWNEAASLACESARAAAWEALSPLGVVPNLLCRTAREHADLKVREPVWTPIDPSSLNC